MVKWVCAGCNFRFESENPRDCPYCGRDVLEKEPPDTDNPLLSCENIIVTPHTAWYTEDSIERLKNLGMDEVVRVLNGKRARYVLNPEVLTK